MKTPKVSPVEAIKASYPRLAQENQQLSESLGALGRSVSGVESSLRRIGLQVSAWHKIAGGENEHNGYRWSREIGYTYIGDFWHIALREWSQADGQEDDITVYKFKDAPPWMCIEAAGKIPGLIEELIERTKDMRARIVAKTKDVEEMADVLEALANEIMTARKK